MENKFKAKGPIIGRLVYIVTDNYQIETQKIEGLNINSTNQIKFHVGKYSFNIEDVNKKMFFFLDEAAEQLEKRLREKEIAQIIKNNR